MQLFVILFSAGCKPGINKSNFHPDATKDFPTKTQSIYAIITQGMHRNHDSIYFVPLPNEFEKRIETQSNWSEEYLLCGYDFTLIRTDSSYNTKRVADINTSCGHMFMNGKTYYSGIVDFISMLKGAYKGVKRIDSSFGEKSECEWVARKVADTNFLGYSMRNDCNELDYKFRIKYHFNDENTINKLMPVIDSYPWGWNSCHGIQTKIIDSIRICSDRHFWTDSVDVCIRSNLEFSEFLDTMKIQYTRFTYKNVYDAYYKTTGRISGIETLDSMMQIGSKTSQKSIVRKFTLPKGLYRDFGTN